MALPYFAPVEHDTVRLKKLNTLESRLAAVEAGGGGGGGGGGGVLSFNTRDGDVTLSSADVVGALGFTPLNIGVDPRQLGAVGDGVTDDYTALQAWLDVGGFLFLPPLLFRSSQKLIVRKHVLLQGVAHGYDSRLATYQQMPGSRIIFDAGVSGLELQTSTTLTDPAAVAAAGAGAFTQEGAFNSEIRDIGLIGQGAGTAFGFMARTFFHARNLQVYQFSGKGFDLNATLIADGLAEYGNLSNSSMDDCGAWQCGSHGLHVRGRDANTCNIKNFNGFGNGGWGIWNQSLIGNVFDKPSLAGNALGAIKADGSQNNTIIFPYIEADAHANCEIGTSNIVIGDILANNNASMTPTELGPITRINRLRLRNTWAPEAMTAEDALLYKWDGLYLQGRGSTKDVTLLNRAGNVAAFVPTNSTNWEVLGTSFGHLFQSLGVNQAWPGAADGYLALLPMAVNGATLGGFGSTGDVSLLNSAGAVAAYVPHATTNFTVVGNVTGANLSGTNTGDQFTSIAQATLVGRAAGAGTGAASALTAAQAKTLLAISTGDVSGLGTVASLASDTDTTLAANSDTRVATQKAVKAYVDNSVAGLLDYKGGIACAANPNYPSALKGDAYNVTTAGKIGGASGKSVDIGDVVVATADNAGGTEAAVGANWIVLEHNLTGALVASNNLSDVASVATARTNLGLTYFATGTDAANLTGTLAAAQLPAFSGGDVTSSAGSSSLTIGAGKVTLAMQANMATASVVYRKSAGAGAPEVQTLATLKTDLGLTGTNSGDQTITLTGDVTGSGTGSFATAIGANKVTRGMLAATAGATLLGATAAGNVADLTAAQAKTFLAITESDVANLTTDLAAKAPIDKPVFTTALYLQQGAPTAKTATGTLTIAELLTLLLTCTSTTAVSLTLPTGTLTDAGITVAGGSLANDRGFEWSIVNLGSSSGACTLVAGTGHTIVGNAVTAISTSSRWLTRKTATNTFVTYRIS
jgi:hypothetical protein